MRKLMAVFITLLIAAGVGWYYVYTSHSHKTTAAIQTKLSSSDIAKLQANTNGGVVADFGNLTGAPLLKTKFGVSNNIASVGLMESMQGNYLDDLGSGLVCTQVEFDQTLKHGTDSSLITPNPALVTTKGADGKEVLSGTPSPWLATYEQAINAKNIPLLIQLGGAPAPYQVDRISKPAEHPAPTDAPTFSHSSAIIGEWTAAAHHAAPVLWSVWHEPEHGLTGIDRSKNIAGDYIAPYSKDNPEPADLYAARDAQSRTDAINILDTIYRTYYKAMAPTVSPYAVYGLAGFLSSGFNPLKLTTKTNLHPAETFFKAFIDTYSANNTSEPTPIQFLSYDSYNGKWQDVVQGTRSVIGTRTDIGPLVFNEYAPSNMKLADNGSPTVPTETSTNGAAAITAGGDSTVSDQKVKKKDRTSTDTTTSKKSSTKSDSGKVTALDAAVQMLSDMSGVLEQPDIAHMCMSYWTGGTDGILNRDKSSSTVAPTVRYAALKLYSELPVTRATLAGSDIVPIGTPGLHGMAGVDFERAGILLWNDGSSDITTSLQLKNIAHTLTTGAVSASVQSITSDTDTTPTVATYTGQSLTIPAHSIALVTIENTDLPAPLLRRHSLTGAQFLHTMPMTDRSETTCTGTTCSMPALHYAAYDSVRSVAYLGTETASKEARVSVTYKNLPKILYTNGIIHTKTTTASTLNLTLASEGCATPVTFTIPPNGALQSIDLGTLDEKCHPKSDTPVTMTFLLQGTEPAQAEVYLSAGKQESNSIAATQ